MSVRVRPAMDEPGVVSFFYGPLLLAGALGTNGMPESDLTTSQAAFHQLLVPPVTVPLLASIAPTALRPQAGKPLTFSAPVADSTNPMRSVEFIPFYELHHQRYSIYWRAK
jgi:hypothetical protein